MDQQKAIIVGVLIVLIISAVYMYNKKQNEKLGLSREDDIKMTLESLNDFKNGFQGTMDPERFRKQLDKKVREFEINNDVRVLKSSILAEGPIILKDS